MNAQYTDGLEQQLRTAGTDLRYPPTPPIAAAVMRRLHRPDRRLISGRRRAAAFAVLAAFVLLPALMLVPSVRAAVLDIIQIGVVRIFRGTAVPPTNTPAAAQGPAAVEVPVTATPMAPVPPTVTSLPSILDLAGETTLAKAQAITQFKILLPTYPPDLGMPDHVYLQNPGDSMLVLIWLQSIRRDQVRMSLQEIGPGSWIIQKFNPPVIQETRVNGKSAVWTAGPYMLEARNGNYVERSLVTGHALIWEQNSITYRLETDLPLEEAIKVAESLKLVQQTRP